MLAVIKSRPEPGLEIADIPDPVIKDNEVLVDIKASGICGTDLAIEKWMDWTADIFSGKFPVVIGHEFGGDVIEVGKDVAMQIAAMNPIAIDKEGVDKDVIDKELEIAKEQIQKEGKPAELAEKIAQGKLGKFFKENTLLNQEFVKDSAKNIKQYLQEIDKDLTVVNFVRVAIG